MEPIVIYSRCSTSDQNFESQFDDLKTWAKGNKFNVVKSFGEKVSGYDQDAERIEYDLMKQYVIDNNIKNIAIWEISRLSRSMVKTVTELDFFTKHKVNIHFKKEGLQSLSDNTTNKLLLTLLSSMAEMERNTFIERGARGRMTAVMKGRMIGYSNPPYGYTSDKNGIIMVEETEAKVIRLMYEMFNKGTSLFGIATHFNSLKIPTRNTLNKKKGKLRNGNEVTSTWKPTVIARNLKRELYKGLRIYKGINIKVPAIVTEEEWNKSQERFKEHLGYINRSKYPYLFKGKMRCGKCGRALVTYTNKNTLDSYYLCCGTSLVGIKCDNGRYINTKLLDKWIYVALINHLEAIEAINSDFNTENRIEEKQGQIEFYKKEIERLERKKKLVTKAYTDEYYTPDEFKREQLTIKNLKTDFESKITLTENELNNFNQTDLSKLFVSIIKTDDFKVKREFVMKYVDNIIIHNVKETNNIDFEFPLHKNEKIIYAKLWAFKRNEPIHIVITPYSKNANIYSTDDIHFDNDGGILSKG
jgi:site-specific DNA recombinase